MSEFSAAAKFAVDANMAALNAKALFVSFMFSSKLMMALAAFFEKPAEPVRRS
jgi:hypothetical protein